MLSNAIVVITGSTSGIGLGIAKEFAAAGCSLVINGFAGPGVVEALVRDLEGEYGVRVLYHPADVADAAQCTALIRDAEAHFGRVDVLVNNAGIQHVAPVAEFPPERWDAILAVLLSAAFHTTRAVLPGMQQRGYGRIINIASVHGLVASTNKCAYVAAKHGLVGLTKVVALEEAGRGITCNAICPGFVRTPLVQGRIEQLAAEKHLPMEEAARQFIVDKMPTERFTTVEEIAGLALFLCSDAAVNLTGAALPIDGGWTAQ